MKIAIATSKDELRKLEEVECENCGATLVVDEICFVEDNL